MTAPCSSYVPRARFGFRKPPLTCGNVVGDTGIEPVRRVASDTEAAARMCPLSCKNVTLYRVHWRSHGCTVVDKGDGKREAKGNDHDRHKMPVLRPWWLPGRVRRRSTALRPRGLLAERYQVADPGGPAGTATDGLARSVPV